MLRRRTFAWTSPALTLQLTPSHHAIGGVISDLDGVAYRDEAAIPGSVEAFRIWRSHNVPYAFVTNNSTKTAEQFAAKLSGIGIVAEPKQVFTTISAVIGVLHERWPADTPIFAIGEAPLLDTLTRSGYRLTETDPHVVVLGHDHLLSYAKLRIAIRAALAGAAVIATNPDVLTPVHDGYDPCVGVSIAAVTAAVPNLALTVVGKPDPFMIEQALVALGTSREQTVMIGDRIATDIAAGKRAGLRAIQLVSDIPFNELAEFVPDLVVSSLLDLHDLAAPRTGRP